MDRLRAWRSESELHDDISSAYASRLDQLVADSRAVLWVHGHTHRNVDYTVGTTRVLTNQRGYAGEFADGFQPALVVEL